jgi:hypothetical protein
MLKKTLQVIFLIPILLGMLLLLAMAGIFRWLWGEDSDYYGI